LTKKNRHIYESDNPEELIPLIPSDEVVDWVIPEIEVIDEEPEPFVSVSAEPEVVEPVAPPIGVVLKSGGGVCPNCHCFYVNDSRGVSLNCKNCSRNVELI
jgi:hypothetical protein